MAQQKDPVVLTRGQVHTGRFGHFILGVLDPRSIEKLKTAEYQRGVRSEKKREGLVKKMGTSGKAATSAGPVSLSMRGDKYDVKPDGSVLIYSQVYIIDGQQRLRSGAAAFAKSGGTVDPTISVELYINMTEDMERELFTDTNTKQVKVSVNHNLRNLMYKSPGVTLMYDVSKDPTFAFMNAVQWGQDRAPHEVIPANTLCKVAAALHVQSGGTLSTKYEHVASSLDGLIDTIGAENVKKNVIMFFDIVDEIWGIRQIGQGERLYHYRDSVLRAMAYFFGFQKDMLWSRKKINMLDEDALSAARMFSFVSNPRYQELADGSTSGPGVDRLLAAFTQELNRTRAQGDRFILPPSRATERLSE